MKTVKIYRPYGGQVVRITDEEAADLVGARKGMYCPKHWLRAARLKEAQERQP